MSFVGQTEETRENWKCVPHNSVKPFASPHCGTPPRTITKFCVSFKDGDFPETKRKQFPKETTTFCGQQIWLPQWIGWTKKKPTNYTKRESLHGKTEICLNGRKWEPTSWKITSGRVTKRERWVKTPQKTTHS